MDKNGAEQAEKEDLKRFYTELSDVEVEFNKLSNLKKDMVRRKIRKLKMKQFIKSQKSRGI